MIRNLLILLIFISMGGQIFRASNTNSPKENRQGYKIFVDKEGVMRRDDTKEEVAYYGTNYTVPFAHAYRALKQKGVNPKDAIDKDVYHMKRLGFNGFRLHLWDVEIADSVGNILDNEHLDLLDYLISKLEKEGIDIVLTAQTNFGNGYPEKNIDTGGFSYDFDKCDIHKNKKAQDLQAKYLKQLASHVNPYTGLSYSDDNAIIAMEINNEPCHTASEKEVTAYINKMVKALKKGGFDKPILYNVSHNPDVTAAYYDADIQGTTYQWYPTGLVAGHQRRGNFLPYVAQYPIPWKDSIKNFGKMAKVVYEFDPGDVLYSYLYPAVARTFRKEGFQWITQFAYDPLDIAKYNTEYQTHFLNLAYTPSKAISMLIAGEAARNIPRGADYGSFPESNNFGNFSVSYEEDLSLLNDGKKFYHSNTTGVSPKNISLLKNVAGVGSSPIVSYNGTGAYFLDELQPGIWRLEVMPDVALTSDPFEKPSLRHEIAKIFYSERPIKINLSSLGRNFYYQGINEGNSLSGEATDEEFKVYPGVYLLSKEKKEIKDLMPLSGDEKEELVRYFAPAPSQSNSVVLHTPSHYIDKNGDLIITAEIIGDEMPQKVTVYPGDISFWRDDNVLIEMQNISGNTYRGVVPNEWSGSEDTFNYNIVVEEKGKKYTWPQNIEGTPLDWDFTQYQYYSSNKIGENSAIILLQPLREDKNVEVAMIPEEWNFSLTPSLRSPVGKDSYYLKAHPSSDGKIILRRYVGDELKNAPFIADKRTIVIKASPGLFLDGTRLGLVGRNGAAYSAGIRDFNDRVEVKMSDEIATTPEYRIPLSSLTQSEVNIVPAVYPSFLPREVNVGALEFNPAEIEYVELVFPSKKGNEIDVFIEGIWLE